MERKTFEPLNMSPDNFENEEFHSGCNCIPGIINHDLKYSASVMFLFKN